MALREGMVTLLDDTGRLTTALLEIRMAPALVRAYVDEGDTSRTIAATDDQVVLAFFTAILTASPSQPSD